MTSEPVTDFLDDLRAANPEQHDLVLRIRMTILALDPKISEEIKYGGILFTRDSPVCGVFPYERHVSLEFGRGAEMSDPHAVLEGVGKLRRHIKITAQADLFRKNIKAYVVQALANMKATRQAQRSQTKPRSQPKPRG